MANKAVFECYRTANGYYNFRLKAPNTVTLAVSGGTGYSSLSNVKRGIESVRKFSAACTGKVEDQTLKTVTELKNPKFEIYADKAGKYRYRLKASNGELLCICESGYASKKACQDGIVSLARWAQEAEIVDLDKQQ